MTGLHLVKQLLVASMLLSSAAQTAHAGNARETEWLHALKTAYVDNGSSLPFFAPQERDVLRIDSGSIKRLLGVSRGDKEQLSRLQFSPVKYQASVADEQFELQIYCRF